MCYQAVYINDGNKIPILGLGTFGKDLWRVKPALIQAIESGYRLIDTAVLYENEEQIGEAVADIISRGIVKREDLWITTKVNFDVDGRQVVLPTLKKSLQRLQLNYVDLFLIHSPDYLYELADYDYLNVWKGLEDVKELNLARSIGVSNFNSTHINRLLVNSAQTEDWASSILTHAAKHDTSVILRRCSLRPRYHSGRAGSFVQMHGSPTVEIITVNPTFSSLDLVAYCQNLNITVIPVIPRIQMVHMDAPFGFLVPRLFAPNAPKTTFEEPLLKELAQKYGKTTRQIVLRYLIDHGTIPIPRSTNSEHMKINIDVLGFYLTPKEVFSINEINKDTKVYQIDQESLFDVLGLI